MNRRRLITGGAALVATALVGHAVWSSRWRYIVIHHSAGNFGTIEFLQRVHRERQPRDPIDAIPYHYVIGNGNGLAEGEVASDWRQKYGLWGAHVSTKNSAHNFLGIGICLIGNFEEKSVSSVQFESLVALTKQLMEKHGIPEQNVVCHGKLGGQSTKCPGRNFPYAEFRNRIRGDRVPA